jgi:hypothetical protein
MTSVPGEKRQLASHLRVTGRGRRSVQLTRSVERVYDLSAGPWSFGLMLGVPAQGLVVLHVVSSTALHAGCWRTWAT